MGEASLASAATREAGVLALQRSSGNRSVAGLLGSGGQALDPAVRTEMERRFGLDFGDVRVHVGKAAAASALAEGARAYTLGRDIVFGEGRYAPATVEGKRLLAHELAHVVQQSRPAAGAPPRPCRLPRQAQPRARPATRRAKPRADARQP